LSKARCRLGVKPLRWLFELLAGPCAVAATGGVRWRRLLVCAIGGTTLSVPDTAANLATFYKQPGNHGGTGYPQLRLLALVACGTRSIIEAVFGPARGFGSGETGYARRLVPAMRPGMLVLADRNFDSTELLTTIAATEAHFLVRAKGKRRLPVLKRYRDGSYLSTIGTLRIRVVEAEITITTSAGRATGVYRLATTLTDHRQYPAGELVKLYHDWSSCTRNGGRSKRPTWRSGRRSFGCPNRGVGNAWSTCGRCRAARSRSCPSASGSRPARTRRWQPPRPTPRCDQDGQRSRPTPARPGRR
jgi:hypothetical protein